MPGFTYQCITGEGYLQDGEISATSVDEACSLLEARGWNVLELGPTDGSSSVATDTAWTFVAPRSDPLSAARLAQAARIPELTSGPPASSSLLKRLEPRWTAVMPASQAPGAQGVPSESRRVRLSRRSLAVFTTYLQAMLTAGFTYTRSLNALAGADDAGVALVSRTLLKGISAGAPLSSAMADLPQAFSPFFVLMVRLGEKTGRVPQVLGRLGSWLREQEERHGRLVAAAVYPAFVVSVSLLMVALLLGYMLPCYLGILEGTAAQVPTLTRLALVAGRHPLPLVAPFVLMMLGLVLWTVVRRQVAMLRALERLGFLLPLVGSMPRDLLTASVCRNLSTLLDSGISALEALRTVRTPTTGWAGMDLALERAERDVKTGQALSSALRSGDVFPEFVLSAVQTGERTARVPEMLTRSAEALDLRVESRLSRMLGVLEPVLVLGMGLLVAFVVLAAYLPVFGLMQAS